MGVPIRSLKALRELASREKHREALRGLRLESSGEMVATDGKVLGVVRREENGSPLGEGIIARDSLDSIIKMAGKGAVVDVDAPRWADPATGADLPISRIEDQRYPEWKRALPEPDAMPTISLALGLPVLERIVKALKALDSDGIRLEVPMEIKNPRIGTVDTAVRFSTLAGAGPGALEGVVMPLAIQRME